MTRRLTSEQAIRAYAKGKGKQPETIILRAVRQYLQQFGWMVVRLQQGMGAHKGLSDLVCIREGRVCWVEIKTPAGRQSPHQRDFERHVTSHGGEYHVLRSVEDAIAMSGERCLL